METTYDGILEAVTLNPKPSIQLVGWDVLMITSIIVRCAGIYVFCTHIRHQLVILIGNEILGSQLRHRVNLVVELLAAVGVFLQSIHLESGADVVEQRLLLFIIRGAEVSCSLKHQVLEIVGKSCCLGRVVAATCSHGDVSKNTRLLLVDGQIDLQPIVEGVNP